MQSANTRIMQRYKLTIEYDGTPFCGMQQQPGLHTVQGVLEDALSKFADHDVEIQASGRTDAGVHATGQVVHVDFQKPREEYKIVPGVNTHLLPHPIVVCKAEKISADFHARFDAIRRHYRYDITNRPARLALDKNRAWHIHQPLNIDAMREAASFLIGKTQDLSSFRASECQAKTPIKTIEKIEVIKTDDMVSFHIAAPSFMHNQVRIMVGTLAEIGMGKRSASSMPEIIKGKNRIDAGITAPAHGLYFTRVEY